MTDSRWGELIDKIEESFGIEEQGREDLEVGYVEFVVFESPLGVMRFERTITPRVESTKTLGGSKHGVGSNIKKIYSDTETVSTFKAYKVEGDDWVEFDGGSLV